MFQLCISSVFSVFVWLYCRLYRLGYHCGFSRHRYVSTMVSFYFYAIFCCNVTEPVAMLVVKFWQGMGILDYARREIIWLEKAQITRHFSNCIQCTIDNIRSLSACELYTIITNTYRIALGTYRVVSHLGHKVPIVYSQYLWRYPPGGPNTHRLINVRITSRWLSAVIRLHMHNTINDNKPFIARVYKCGSTNW